MTEDNFSAQSEKARDDSVMLHVFSELREIHKICQNFQAGRLLAAESELERYREIDRGRAFDDILRDIARIYIDHEHVPEMKDDKDLRGRVKNILLDILQVLEDYGASPQKTPTGGERKLRMTQVAGYTDTEDPALKGKVSESIQTGFSRGNSVLVKELVRIYRLREKTTDTQQDNKPSDLDSDSNEKVYGIDLGDTYSAIATLDGNSKPEVLEILSEVERTLASAVYFLPSGSYVVGGEAKAMAEFEPDRVIQFVKRQIGKDNVRYSFDGIEYDPITVSAIILKHMKEDIEAQGYPVKKVVMTCPVYFGHKERVAIRQAGEIAGLDVLDIIHEPTAIALSYCSRESSENRRIMIYDLGGDTFDITLLDFSVDESSENAKISIIDSSGDDKLGGIDWDKRLFEYICEVYADDNGIDTNDIEEGTKAEIRALTEDTKKKLSLRPAYKLNIEGSRIEIEAEKFRERTIDLVDRTIYFIEQLLQKNGLSHDNVDTVLLAGGSAKMPMIQEAVKAMFPDKGNGSLRVRVEDPDFAVAKGAAIYAAMKVTEGYIVY